MRCELAHRFALNLVGSLALATAGLAQLTVEAPADTPVVAWVGTPHSAPPTGKEPSAKPVTLDKRGATEKSVVMAYDAATNRIAQQPWTEGVWTLATSDFKRIGRVVLTFQADGKPVASLSFRVKAGGESWVGLIAPGDKGQAVLWSVPPGDLAIEATYRSGGESRELKPSPRFALKLEDAKAMGPIIVSLPTGVDVVEAETKPGEPAPAAKAEAKETPTESGSPIGRTMVYLAGLLVGGATLYLVIRLASAHRPTIDQQLGKLGVSIPTDPVPDDPAPAAKPEPVPQILLGDAPVMPAAAPITVAANPRLVLDGGDVILIPAGTTVLGREASADHALTDQTTLSRRHAQFDRVGDVVTLTDLGSTNGIYVNGIKLETTGVELKPGDQVQFGALATRYQI